MKFKSFSLFRFNRFHFGDQVVSQFVVFESKHLFSMIFFYFHKCQGSQDRFHTHAFNAWSLRLFGTYNEYVLESEETGKFHTRPRKNGFQFFPRDSYHKIGDSTGCLTLLFSGRWKRHWKEWANGKITHYTWGREEK